MAIAKQNFKLKPLISGALILGWRTPSMFQSFKLTYGHTLHSAILLLLFEWYGRISELSHRGWIIQQYYVCVLFFCLSSILCMLFVENKFLNKEGKKGKLPDKYKYRAHFLFAFVAKILQLFHLCFIEYLSKSLFHPYSMNKRIREKFPKLCFQYFHLWNWLPFIFKKKQATYILSEVDSQSYQKTCKKIWYEGKNCKHSNLWN